MLFEGAKVLKKGEIESLMAETFVMKQIENTMRQIYNG
jgi:hypothetical protein